MLDPDPACEVYLNDHRERHLADLFDWLRIPSVSTLPERQPEMVRAADWLVARLRAIGAERVEMMPTAGHPVVVGHWPAPPGAPTALLYGHYDVQPPDPLELWETPPFAPAVRDGKIYARGASDDKGNLLAALSGIEALVTTRGQLPIGLTALIEGEEEVGSPSLGDFARQHAERLACDLALSADGTMVAPGVPSLTVAMKGLAGCQIDLRTAARDTHSGLHGATIPNAAQAIARLVATLHDADGRVAVAGFYDDARDLTAEERAWLAELPFDEDAYRRDLGLTSLWGEPGYAPLERSGARPTIDVNGIWSGFQGEGTKTVTPAEAHAKLTCRLVPGQEPERVLDLLQAHIDRHRPTGTTVTLRRRKGARPYVIRPDHPGLRAAERTLEHLYGRPPLKFRNGGTLSIATTLQETLGADMIFFAWGSPYNNAHAPNEAFPLASFDRSRRGYALLLPEVARVYREAGAFSERG